VNDELIVYQRAGLPRLSLGVMYFGNRDIKFNTTAQLTRSVGLIRVFFATTCVRHKDLEPVETKFEKNEFLSERNLVSKKTA